jgi:hypothetical protein
MPICPAGHQTSQTDFCDICGLPVTPGQADQPPAPPLAVVGGPVVCPHCQTPNVADALFCEACGYDFTTGTLPEPVAGSEPVSTGSTSDTPLPEEPSAPESVPEEPVKDEDAIPPAPEERPRNEDASRRADEVSTSSTSDSSSTSESVSTPQPPAPARPEVEWVAELWIDPDWYAAQGSTDPLPSPGLPDIVPLVKESNLIGRVSHSRAIFPDVDCELDTGCSRRHAMLTTDGTRWWIEDLNSANGTFVGAAAGPLPAMPIPQGRVELSPGQRIYVGAWTRIVVRRATDDEKEAFAA